MAPNDERPERPEANFRALLEEARQRRHQTERQTSREDEVALTVDTTFSPLRVAQDRQRLAAFVDASPEFAAVTDPQGELLFLNRTSRPCVSCAIATPAQDSNQMRAKERKGRPGDR